MNQGFFASSPSLPPPSPSYSPSSFSSSFLSSSCSFSQISKHHKFGFSPFWWFQEVWMQKTQNFYLFRQILPVFSGFGLCLLLSEPKKTVFFFYLSSSLCLILEDLDQEKISEKASTKRVVLQH